MDNALTGAGAVSSQYTRFTDRRQTDLFPS